MNNAIETYKTTNGNTVNIYYDTDAESPREWDNIGVIVVQETSRYLNSEYKNEDLFYSKEQDEELLSEEFAYVFPLYCLDHSAVAFSLGFIDSPWGRWDCGQIGWYCVPKDKAEADNLNEARARELCAGELETLTQYTNGEVYGFVVENENGNHVDSCSGYYSIDDIKAEWPEVTEEKVM
jgi:hypothetical protein